MATRSAIALQRPNGSFSAIYCHWDGYPSHHLPLLQKHHNSARAAAALIRPGDISCLRTRTTWQSGATLRDSNGEPVLDAAGYWRHEQDRDAQPLYYHERGEQDVAPRRFADTQALTDWADGCSCEHVYIYRARHGWQHYELRATRTAEPSPMPGCDPAQY